MDATLIRDLQWAIYYFNQHFFITVYWGLILDWRILCMIYLCKYEASSLVTTFSRIWTQIEHILHPVSKSPDKMKYCFATDCEPELMDHTHFSA